MGIMTQQNPHSEGAHSEKSKSHFNALTVGGKGVSFATMAGILIAYMLQKLQGAVTSLFKKANDVEEKLVEHEQTGGSGSGSISDYINQMEKELSSGDSSDTKKEKLQILQGRLSLVQEILNSVTNKMGNLTSLISNNLSGLGTQISNFIEGIKAVISIFSSLLNR